MKIWSSPILSELPWKCLASLWGPTSSSGTYTNKWKSRFRHLKFVTWQISQFQNPPRRPFPALRPFLPFLPVTRSTNSNLSLHGWKGEKKQLIEWRLSENWQDGKPGECRASWKTSRYNRIPCMPRQSSSTQGPHWRKHYCIIRCTAQKYDQLILKSFSLTDGYGKE